MKTLTVFKLFLYGTILLLVILLFTSFAHAQSGNPGDPVWQQPSWSEAPTTPYYGDNIDPYFIFDNPLAGQNYNMYCLNEE